jgi:hypothetical protein
MRAWTAGVVVSGLLMAGPVWAGPPEASAPSPSAAAPDETQPDAEATPGEPGEPGEPAPTHDSEPLPEPDPVAEPTTAPVAEAEPAPEPEPVEPRPTVEVVPDDGLKGRRTLGLGLLIAGSGFVAIGGGTAAAYGVQDGKCGGSCIGGIVVAATGIAGVVVGALLVARHPKTATARRAGRTLARWRPGHGVQF